MSEIVYTSLVRAPEPMRGKHHAMSEMMEVTGDMPLLYQMGQEQKSTSRWITIDDYHFNIIRTFVDLATYQTWIYSEERNEADQKLMDAGWFLYTKQGHDYGIKRPQIATDIR